MLYPDKPPLFFWLVAVVYALIPAIDVALFLPALASGVLVTALVADLGRRLWGASTGLWCGAVLLALLQFPLQMKSGQIDALLCLWTTLGLYGFCRHLLLGPDWRWYGIGGLAAGFGIITKGVGFRRTSSCCRGRSPPGVTGPEGPCRARLALARRADANPCCRVRMALAHARRGGRQR